MKNELLNFIESQVAKDEFSGIVLVVKDNKLCIEFVTGFSNQAKQSPNLLTTKFNIGSIDKSFTAVAIAQLVENNKISFNDKVSKYIKHCPKAVADKMTIHHILTHTEGFSSYFNKQYIAKRMEIKTIDEYLSLFINEPLLFDPGSRYQYSNSGYVVLGAIIEVVTGKSYYDYVKERIFNVASMEKTTSMIKLEDPSYAHGYTYRKLYSQELDMSQPRRDNEPELPLISSPAGGSFSTCYDLYNFSQALLSNKLLSKKMTDQVLKPQVEIGTKNNETLYYGYGFQILKSGKYTRYGHAGVMAGANARLDMYPALGYTVVVLSNYDEPSAFKIANESGKLILRN